VAGRILEASSRHDMAQPTYEVLALRYATRLTSKRECFLNYHLYHEPDADLVMDYFVWVVRNPDRTIVVDTGFTEDVGARRSRTMLRDPLIGLGQLGIEATALPQLILTHAHYDHAGNVGRFPSSEVVMSRREFEFWTGPFGSRAQFAHSTEAADIEHLRAVAAESRLCLVAGSYRVAPGIEIIELSGHTPGQLVVRVATNAGTVVLASDAMHYYEEIERDRPFAIVVDLEGMYRSFDALREMQSEAGCVLVAGHDPAVMTRFPTLEGHGGFVVRVA
jgi:glyoxylase-like metal-dependent hydrolase (beta-lactamase superfamily II)